MRDEILEVEISEFQKTVVVANWITLMYVLEVVAELIWSEKRDLEWALESDYKVIGNGQPSR